MQLEDGPYRAVMGLGGQAHQRSSLELELALHEQAFLPRARKPEQQVEQQRLPRARGADEQHALATSHVERGRLEQPVPVAADSQVLRDEERVRHGPSAGSRSKRADRLPSKT